MTAVRRLSPSMVVTRTKRTIKRAIRMSLFIGILLWTESLLLLYQHTIANLPFLPFATAAFLLPYAVRTHTIPSSGRVCNARSLRPCPIHDSMSHQGSMTYAVNEQYSNGNGKSSNSNNNQRRKDYDPAKKKRRTQLIWVTQSLERTLPLLSMPSTASIVLDEINSFKQNSYSEKNQRLIDAMWGLVNARTNEQIRLCGIDLEQVLWDSSGTHEALLAPRIISGSTPKRPTPLLWWPVSVLERVIKAIAMMDPPEIIISTAIYITETILDAGILPSNIAQDALCSGLRRANMTLQFEKVIRQLQQTSLQLQNPQYISTSDGIAIDLKLQKTSPAANMSTVAFNLFLASLCDNIQVMNGNRMTRPNPDRVYYAWMYLHSSLNRGGVQPDAVSFTTLLQAARSINNMTLSNEIWSSLQAHRHIIPSTILSYNARLGCLQNQRNQPTSESDAASFQLYQDLLQDPDVRSPDQYTIDLMLMPMARCGRLGETCNLLDGFIAGHINSPRVVSEAFESFLFTLVQGDEIAFAKSIFDTYIRPMLSSVVESRVGEFRLVHPTIRHWNILLDGYQTILREQRSRQKQSDSPMEMVRSPSDGKDGTLDEAWSLFRLLLRQPSRNCIPDSFTVTIMMGLCRNSDELIDILYMAITQFGIRINFNSPILRAALTSWGNLGDASSACWNFGSFLASQSSMTTTTGPGTTASTYAIRAWNALLQSLSTAAHVDLTNKLNLGTSLAAIRLGKLISFCPHDDFLTLVDGRTIPDAAKCILDAMIQAQEHDNTHVGDIQWPTPTAQTYCTVLSTLQLRNDDDNGLVAMDFIRHAIGDGIQVDGRLVNAVLRCYGVDIDSALLSWKNELRMMCLTREQRSRRQVTTSPPYRIVGMNLIAGYHGLLYVTGRAIRPDIALRLVYAMRREGLEADETALNCYRSGKRIRMNTCTLTINSTQERRRLDENITTIGTTTGIGKFGLVGVVTDQFKFTSAYESLLTVECTRYDQNDQRRVGEKRVRIIF